MGYGVAITRRRQAVSHAGVLSELAHQIAYRLKEFMRQLDHSVINSIRSGTEGGAADYSSMGGLIEFVSASGGNINTTAEAISPSVLNEMIKQIWDDGGMVAGGRLCCLVGGVLKRKISGFDQAYRRLDYESRAAGYVVERFLSDLGFEVEVIVDWLKGSTLNLIKCWNTSVSKLTEALKSLVETISRRIYEHSKFMLVGWCY